MKHSILLIKENNEAFVKLFLKNYSKMYDCNVVDGIMEARSYFDEGFGVFCAVIAPYSGSKTIEFFENCRDFFPTASRIMIAQEVDINIAIESINKAKVFSYFQHPVDMKELAKELAATVLEFEKIKKFQVDSLTDPLTNLYNRRFMDKELDRVAKVAIRHEHTYAIIFGDVNRFKGVNDTYGHTLGDILLKKISSVFVETCRGSDLICRYGGDEFLILIEESSNDQAKLLINRLNESMEKLVIPEMPNEKFSLSLGEASFPEDGNSVKEILDAADKRMYEVKRGISKNSQ